MGRKIILKRRGNPHGVNACEKCLYVSPIDCINVKLGKTLKLHECLATRVKDADSGKSDYLLLEDVSTIHKDCKFLNS